MLKHAGVLAWSKISGSLLHRLSRPWHGLGPKGSHRDRYGRSEGGAGRAQAARQRVQCVAGEALIVSDDDDQSVDMDKLVFRPNPERLGLELSHSDDEE